MYFKSLQSQLHTKEFQNKLLFLGTVYTVPFFIKI